jgi:hypothetical protein
MRPHEQEILSVVTNCVRALTVRQVARSWWSDSRKGVARAETSLHELADDGWLQLQTVLARPVPLLQAPLATWMPGDRVPGFPNLSKLLHQRAMVPAKLATVIFATSKSTALFGKGALPKIKLTQMTHDLQLAEIFLVYRSRGLPIDQWLGEDHLPHSWPIQQRPDSVLKRTDGTIYRAIEYGGDYSPERLAELHEALSSIGDGLPYEIW